MTDNGVQFQAETTELLWRYGIEHHKSSPYRPQANGAVEVANKNVKRILLKMVKTTRIGLNISLLPYGDTELQRVQLHDKHRFL